MGEGVDTAGDGGKAKPQPQGDTGMLFVVAMWDWADGPPFRSGVTGTELAEALTSCSGRMTLAPCYLCGRRS